MEETPKMEVISEIDSQEKFQEYYENGIRGAKTPEEFEAFIQDAQKYKYKPEITATLFLLGIQKSAEITTKAVIDAFKKSLNKE